MAHKVGAAAEARAQSQAAVGAVGSDKLAQMAGMVSATEAMRFNFGVQ